MENEAKKNNLKYWLIGLFTGGAIFTPITAYIVRKLDAKKIEEAEIRGMNNMAEFAVQQIEKVDEAVVKVDESKQEEPEDINDYCVEIDDLDATEQARERTEAHERYLDMIDKYNGNAEIRPHIISEDEFSNEQYMEKTFVNWYEEDNVFEEDLNIIDDPYATFGVVNGAELFFNAQLRPDPDICYVRNERITTDFEISRIHGSYAKMVGGERGLGETDT